MLNAISPGFELVSPNPIPATINITPRAPPKLIIIIVTKPFHVFCWFAFEFCAVTSVHSLTGYFDWRLINSLGQKQRGQISKSIVPSDYITSQVWWSADLKQNPSSVWGGRVYCHAQTVQARRAIQAGNGWGSKEKLMSNIFLGILLINISVYLVSL